jgi:hypothetical protein
MSTLDDRSFRKLVSALLRDLAGKVDRREVAATDFAALPLADCPPGYAIHKITFLVRRSS